MVATVPSMIGQFNMNNIHILMDMGYQVDVAADFKDTSVWPMDRIERFKALLQEMNIDFFQIDFSRNPLKLNKHIASFKEVIHLIHKRQYSFIHTHTPIASAIVRLAAKKTGTKVIYTAHGFHFYDGAPLKSWLVYYPVEKFLSRYTDVLITINKEDYKRAKEKFHAKKTEYVPGVGVDTEKFAPRKSGRERIRTELGLKDEDIMLLSVGELNENKNHESVIRAIKGMDVTYVIAGKGEKRNLLEQIAKECGVDLRLVGVRTDVSDFYDAADVYVLPSIGEGLNVSLMEAMASGLSCAVSRIRGNTDLIDDEAVLFDSQNEEQLRESIESAVKNLEEYSQKNLKKMRGFNLSVVENLVSEIYEGGGEHLLELYKRQVKRKEIGIPFEATLLISVGELSVRKNHKVVVKALQELHDNYWYVIVGKGELKDELKSMDKTGRLRLLGFRTDIVELLHCSDLFVFPSLQEGLPVALMEAMASGLPCVASRIRGNTDLIEDNGCLFETKHAEALKNVILVNTAALNNWRIKNNLNKAKIEIFSNKRIDRTMTNVYKKI